MRPGNTLRVVEERARELAGALEGFLEGILSLEETDPQLHAVARVAGAHGPGYASVTSVLVALVSYRLAMRGEEWWTCYGEFFSTRPAAGDPLEAAARVREFLAHCPGAAAQREARARRVERAARGARGLLARLMEEPTLILDSARPLLEALSKALGQEPYRKTIAFAAKMAYYAARTVAGRVPAPGDAPIPVDLRVSCVTVSSGLVEPPVDYRLLLRRPRLVVDAWGLVSSLSGVPALNLDSLLWLVGWAPRDLPLEEARRVIRERLEPHLPGRARVIALQLARRPCGGMGRSHHSRARGL